LFTFHISSSFRTNCFDYRKIQPRQVQMYVYPGVPHALVKRLLFVAPFVLVGSFATAATVDQAEEVELGPTTVDLRDIDALRDEQIGHSDDYGWSYSATTISNRSTFEHLRRQPWR
jgi:hypothetical protein